MYHHKWLNRGMQVKTQRIQDGISREEQIAATKQQVAVCPSASQLLRCLEFFDPGDTKVTILGQDPYHSIDQFGITKANGLAFGINPEYQGRVDGSLNNISKELQDSIGQRLVDTSLVSWAKQGVLLLNTHLSCAAGNAMTHGEYDWPEVTAAIMQKVSDSAPDVIWLLWGRKAQAHFDVTFPGNHSGIYLRAPHPSPLSAHQGFLGCDHFGKVNDLMEGNQIRWGEIV